MVLAEPEGPAFPDCLPERDCVVAATALLEPHPVLSERQGETLQKALNFLVARPNVEVVAFDGDHLRVAKPAFDMYGKGRGRPAVLDHGDRVSRAVAKHPDVPLLFKGDDFIHTDIRPAFQT